MVTAEPSGRGVAWRGAGTGALATAAGCCTSSAVRAAARGWPAPSRWIRRLLWWSSASSVNAEEGGAVIPVLDLQGKRLTFAPDHLAISGDHVTWIFG